MDDVKDLKFTACQLMYTFMNCCVWWPGMSINNNVISVQFCTISAFSLYGEYVVRSFLSDNGVFISCDHGWIFYISLCENSINKSIMVGLSPTLYC